MTFLNWRVCLQLPHKCFPSVLRAVAVDHRRAFLPMYRLCPRMLPAFNQMQRMTTNMPKTSSGLSVQPLRPPGTVMGMTVLDQSQFAAVYPIPVLRLTFAQFQNESLKSDLRSVSLKLIGIPNVQDVFAADEKTTSTSNNNKDRLFKKVLLRPDKIACYSDLPERVTTICACPENLVFEQLALSYENWPVADIINAVLPDANASMQPSSSMDMDDSPQRTEMDKVSGWSTIGHILHLNLRDSNLPYKHIIGEILLSKHRPRIRTVVNKTQNIDSQYRFFQMELLAGEPDFIVQVKENRVQYKFDFSKVYWNPRLSTEHERLVDFILKPPSDAVPTQHKSSPIRTIVFDMFAGVGPFVIPLAKNMPSTSKIYANDLNPECVKWLRNNAIINKIDPHILECCDNMDAAEFLRQIVPRQLESYIRNCETCGHDEDEDNGQQYFYIVHFIMNLPAMAYTFLDQFVGVVQQNVGVDDKQSSAEYEQALRDGRVKFLAHLYYFDKPDYDSIEKRVNSLLGTSFTLENLKPIFVRNVAPNKDMQRVTFEIPLEVLQRRSTTTDEVEMTEKFSMQSGRLKRRVVNDDVANPHEVENEDEEHAATTTLVRAAKNVKISL